MLRCESIVKKFSFYIFFERSFVIGSFAHKMLSTKNESTNSGNNRETQLRQ
jgi:hypothetical protein